MNTKITFWIIFIILTVAVSYCNRKYYMLKDTSNANLQPYSWARVQLSWWTIIILSAFIAIILKYDQAPELHQSTIILLGISALTIVAARAIDVSDTSANGDRHQDERSSGFFLDILSDQTGVSIHRFQTIVFNFVFGVWFITNVLNNLESVPLSDLNSIIPVIQPNNLILLGLSSATYAILKSTENKAPNNTAEVVQP